MPTMCDVLEKIEMSKELIRFYQSYWPNIVEESLLPEVYYSQLSAWNDCDEDDIVLQETMKERYGIRPPHDREEVFVRIAIEIGIRIGLEWAAGNTASIKRPTGALMGEELKAEGEEAKTSAE